MLFGMVIYFLLLSIKTICIVANTLVQDENNVSIVFLKPFYLYSLYRNK